MRQSRALQVSIGVLLGTLSYTAVHAQSLGDLANQVLQQTKQTQGSSNAGVLGAALSNSDIASGLKQALAQGTRNAVNQLGHSGGFWANERFRIPLPGPLQKATGLLQAAGYGSQLDQLHLSINRAAEQAVPLAADVFGEAVQKLSINDVRGILNGPQDAATQYFKRTTSDTLLTRFQPVVRGVTSKVGLVQRYNSLLSSAGPASSLLGPSTDINHYVAQKALDGLFSRVGDEEHAIRTNPAARSTDLLKKVFGGS